MHERKALKREQIVIITSVKRRINISTLLGNWKIVEFKVTFIPIIIDALSTATKKFNKRRGRLRNIRINGHHLNYCIIEIGQNTEKSPWDLRRLSVTRAPVKDHQLTLMWKREIIIIWLYIVMLLNISILFKYFRGCPRGVMVNAMDYRIIVSEFVLQSHYYVHFRTNTLKKGTNPHILPIMG